MRTRIILDLDDRTRARIRAFYGKAGLATRREIERFVLDELDQSYRELPEPKTRGRAAKADPKLAPPAPEGSTSAWRLAVAQAHDDALCGRCGKPKHAHGKAALLCPIGKSIKPGSGARFLPFAPAPEEVTS